MYSGRTPVPRRMVRIPQNIQMGSDRMTQVPLPAARKDGRSGRGGRSGRNGCLLLPVFGKRNE